MPFQVAGLQSSSVQPPGPVIRTLPPGPLSFTLPRYLTGKSVDFSLWEYIQMNLFRLQRALRNVG
jgi:hypothetical protein